MTETQINSVALFFYFTLLDEELADRISREAIKKIRDQFEKRENSKAFAEAIVIHQCTKLFEKARKEHVLNTAHLSQKAKYILPTGLSFGAWRQFHKESSIEDLESLVWSRVLGFSDEVIAQGLGVTVGTVRYRVGRSLRQLGHLITLGELIV